MFQLFKRWNFAIYLYPQAFKQVLSKNFTLEKICGLELTSLSVQRLI
jgi:hypothetical protein